MHYELRLSESTYLGFNGGIDCFHTNEIKKHRREVAEVLGKDRHVDVEHGDIQRTVRLLRKRKSNMNVEVQVDIVSMADTARSLEETHISEG